MHEQKHMKHTLFPWFEHWWCVILQTPTRSWFRSLLTEAFRLLDGEHQLLLQLLVALIGRKVQSVEAGETQNILRLLRCLSKVRPLLETAEFNYVPIYKNKQSKQIELKQETTASHNEQIWSIVGVFPSKCSVEFSENSQKKMLTSARFHPLLLWKNKVRWGY